MFLTHQGILFILTAKMLVAPCNRMPTRPAANAYYNKRQYDLAIADYNQAIALDPKDAKAYYYKAITFEKAGRNREAIEAYKAFLRYAVQILAFLMPINDWQRWVDEVAFFLA